MTGCLVTLMLSRHFRGVAPSCRMPHAGAFELNTMGSILAVLSCSCAICRSANSMATTAATASTRMIPLPGLAARILFWYMSDAPVSWVHVFAAIRTIFAYLRSGLRRIGLFIHSKSGFFWHLVHILTLKIERIQITNINMHTYLSVFVRD